MVQSSIANSNELHDLLMKDHIDETLKNNRKHLDRYRQVGASNYLTESPDSSEQEDQMRILASGNVTVNQAVPPPVQPSQSGLSKALLLAAALLGGPVGLAVGIGGAWLLNREEKPAAVAPVAPQPGKTTTIERDYEVGPVKIEPPSLFDLQEP